MFKKLFGSKKQEEKRVSVDSSLKTLLEVDEIIHETNEAISIVFKNPESGAYDYKPGQFLTLIVPIKGQEVRRSYSLCTTPFADKKMAVTVKRIEDGLVSNYLNDNLKVGDKIKVLEPMGSFTTQFSTDSYRHLVMIGGGSGITPLMSILRSALIKEPNSMISLIYANRNQDSVIFQDKIESLTQTYGDRFHVVNILDEAPEGWEGHQGLLTTDKLQEIFKELPKRDQAFTEYFLCGPSGMMDVVLKTLGILNIGKKQVHREIFVSTSNNPLNNKTEQEQSDMGLISREVTIILRGNEHKFTVEPEQSILEAGLDLDLDMPFSCQSGLCTACRGKLISGQVKMDESDGLTEAEKDQGYVLNCTGHPMTDDVRIEID